MAQPGCDVELGPATKAKSLPVTLSTDQDISLASLPVITPGASSKVTYSTSTQSGALTGTIIRVVSTTDCHITIGANPTAVADGTSMFLPAGVPEYFRITSGHKVAAIQDASAGILFITLAS